jgi:hypothetical protein
MKTMSIFQKQIKVIFQALLLISVVFLSACEDVIDVELPQTEPLIVVDAMINNKPEPQYINVTRTQEYFDATFPPGISDATVQVTDLQTEKIYMFEEGDNEGQYIWSPTATDPSFGIIGHSYELRVSVNGIVYESFSQMNRVPQIDSITFRFEKGNSFFPDSYFGQMYATDFEGIGDTYWIKAFKNGQYLNKPNEINIAFDAGFTAGGNIDGTPFIQPIRDGINPFDQDEDDNFLSPYDPGDSVYVEIHSITNETFFFLTEVQIQIDRPGGFAELFATPLSNVPTNIVRKEETPGRDAIGYFNVAAVETGSGWLDPNDLPPEE